MDQVLHYGAAGCAGLGLVALTAWRPHLGAALLMLALPLAGGLASGSLIKPDQGALLAVGAGTLVHELPRRRTQLYTGLDLAVLAYAAGGVLIPGAVLTLDQAPIDSTVLRSVLQPAQYLLVFLIFSRQELTPGMVRLILNGAMLGSVIVAAVAVAELFGPSLRDLLGRYYSTPPLLGGDAYRPASTLGHYSGVAGFGLLNFTLALALAVTRRGSGSPGLPAWWLTTVMIAGLVGIIASSTWAPLGVLPVAALAVCWHARWRPGGRLLLAATGVLGAALVVFLPFVLARVREQLGGQGSLLLPETLVTRVRWWRELFVPAWLNHGLWLGTGTLIPAEVPRFLVDSVDNEFLYAAFRAGLIGVALLAGVLAAVALGGLDLRDHPDRLARSVGAAALASAVTVALMGLSAEYLTFAGVSQELWMLVGLLASRRLPGATRAPAGALVI